MELMTGTSLERYTRPARLLPEPVVLGSVIGMGTVELCNALIDDALAKGAKLLCGGKADSTLMPATLLDHVTPKMRIYHEETFGPVKAIVRVKDTEEAIACANDNEYGLSAAVFGRDTGRARAAFAQQLRLIRRHRHNRLIYEPLIGLAAVAATVRAFGMSAMARPQAGEDGAAAARAWRTAPLAAPGAGVATCCSMADSSSSRVKGLVR